MTITSHMISLKHILTNKSIQKHRCVIQVRFIYSFVWRLRVLLRTCNTEPDVSHTEPAVWHTEPAVQHRTVLLFPTCGTGVCV